LDDLATDQTRLRLDLLDYRRQVGELYGEIRRLGSGDPRAFRLFQETRNRLFARHPRSPLDPAQRREFNGLRYYPYDPALRFCLPLDRAVEPERFEIQLRDDGKLVLERFAKVHFGLDGPATLSLFWLVGYGGGLFLPFRDAGNGAGSYGGGRYLLDTIKGADLGQQGERIVIDFNYAYNPSCAYNARWECPLAPHENRLDTVVAAGEMSYPPS
jgi:uncharacterized protein (DUF1684 family)